MKQQVLDCFAKLFGGEGDIRTYFAPGRVNLIGEHTDYNGGHVFPCALTIGTYMAARKRDDRKLRFYSMNFEKLGVVESSLDEFLMGKEGNDVGILPEGLPGRAGLRYRALRKHSERLRPFLFRIR